VCVDAVQGDAWGFGVNMANQANVDLPKSWWGGALPWLAALKSRRKGIYEQLAAIEAGTFPRPTADMYAEGEICVDWTETEASSGGSSCGSPCSTAEVCYSAGCAFRKDDGTWNPPYNTCDPANGYCDECFPDSACAMDEGTPSLPWQPGPDEPVQFNQVVISEVSSTAVEGVCGGEDWIELTNPTTTTKYLAGLVLHDDKGWDHADAYHFPAMATIAPATVTIVCCNTADGIDGPKFKIGGNDEIGLFKIGADGGGEAITSSGIIGGEEGVVGEGSWSLAEDGFYSFQPQSAYAFGKHEGEVPEEEKEDVVEEEEEAVEEGEEAEEEEGQNLDALGKGMAGRNLASVGVLLVAALGAAVNV